VALLGQCEGLEPLSNLNEMRLNKPRRTSTKLRIKNTTGRGGFSSVPRIKKYSTPHLIKAFLTGSFGHAARRERAVQHL
jgi:hypothetical protein